MRSVGSERANAAWGEQSASLFSCNLKAVVESAYTDFPCQLWFRFGYSGKECRKIIDCVDSVFVDSLGDLRRICYVNDHRRPAFSKFAFRLRAGDVTGNYISVGVFFAKSHGQFGTNLTGSPDNQYIFHDIKNVEQFRLQI